MTAVYTQHLRDVLHAAANRRALRVMEGIYAFTSGPVFETPAEIHMYGHMGNERVTVKNLKLVRVDAEQNLMLVKGAVPGGKNGLVQVRMA